MKQGSGGCHSWLSILRGKRAGRVCESDMNASSFASVCVHIEFPLRTLSEPGRQPSKGSKGFPDMLKLSFTISARQLLGQTQTPSIKVLSLDFKKKAVDSIDSES